MEKLVVFDLDGTLVETAGDLTRALNRVLAEEALPPVSLEKARPLISYGAIGLVELGFAASGHAVPDPARLRALADRLVVFYEADIAAESRPFPGAVEALDELAEAGWRLAVCTNKREGLSLQLLETLGLRARFAAICGSDTFDVRKPHPEHLLLTIKRAGGDPARTIMVGDAQPDVDVARAAKVHVIGFDFGYSPTPMADLAPDVVLSHYDGLVPAIRDLMRRRAG